MKLAHLVSAIALAGCVTQPAAAPSAPLYHYVRSNLDGSLPEHIYVFRDSAARLEVGKMVEACTNAAFVTAELDLEAGQPRALVGGRLARDGSQDAFAWINFDPAARTLHARVPMANVDQTATIAGHQPWLLYDFDLADLSGLNASDPLARTGFTRAIMLLWPPGAPDDVLRDLGDMHARFAAAERRRNHDTLRFDVSGALTGQLWLDEAQGFVVEAAFDQPNHAEYDSFHLVLQNVEADGAAAWSAVRAAHWDNCP